MKIFDYVVIILILGLAAAFALTKTEHTGLNPVADVIGSDGLPKILYGLAILCCTWMIFFSSWQKRKGTTQNKAVAYSRAALAKMGVFSLAIIMYIIGFLKIGFCVSTVIFVGGLTFYLEPFNKKAFVWIAVYAVAFTAVCHYTFKAFNIMVPYGLLF